MEVKVRGGWLDATTCNVSYSGGYLRCDKPVPVNHLIIMRVQDGSGEFTLSARVIHHSWPLPAAGFGFRLYGVDRTHARRWEALVKKLGCE